MLVYGDALPVGAVPVSSHSECGLHRVAERPGSEREAELPLRNEPRALPRHRSVAVVLLGIAIFGLLWAGILLHLQQREAQTIAQAHGDLGSLSMALRDDVQRTLTGVDQVLRFIVADHRDDPATFDFNAWIRRADGLRDVLVQMSRSDADGIVLASSEGSPPIRISVADRDAFQAHAAGAEIGLFVGRPLIGKVTRRWSFQLSRRLENPDGGFAGVVIASVDPGRLAQRFATLDLGPDAAVTLLGTDGYTRARMPGVPGMYETPLRDRPELAEVFDRLDAGRDGTVRITSALDGTERVFGYRRLPDLPLAVVVGRSVDALLAPLAEERRRLLALGAGATLVLAAMFAMLAREFRRRCHNERALYAAHRELAAAEAVARDRNRSLLAAERVAQLGHWRLDLPDRLTWSPEIFRIHGRRLSDGPPSFAAATAAYHPDDRPEVERIVNEAIAGGRAFECRFRIVRPSGEIRHVVARGRIERDATGTVVAVFGVTQDVTEQRRTELALAESEARYRLLAETTGDVIVRVDCGMRRLYVSPSALAVLGHTPAAMLSDHPPDRTHPADAARLRSALFRLAAGNTPGDSFVKTFRKRHGAGHWVWLEGAARLARDADGKPASIVVTLRDVSARREAELAMQASEAQFRLLAEHSGDIVALSGLDGVRQYVSPAAARVLGWPPEALVGRAVQDFVHPDDVARLAAAQAALHAGESENGTIYRHRRADGAWQWVEGRARLHRHPETGAPAGYVVVIRDATSRKAEEEVGRVALERMQVMAETDALTGLANRRRLEAALEAEWRRAARDRGMLSLLMIDADRFKAFNDTYGHPAGDACLRELAVVIEAVARRPGDLAARFGGEEFVLLMPATDAASAAAIAERLREAVQQRALPHVGNPPSHAVTVSVGVATAQPLPLPNGESGGGPATLVEAADAALYGAKSAGRNRVISALPLRAPEANHLAA